jgi:hypothetical protein
MRVNLGAGFAHLFNGEENKITVTFKLYNGSSELFYKEDEQLLYSRSRPYTRMDGDSAPIAKYSLKDMRDAQLMERF